MKTGRRQTEGARGDGEVDWFDPQPKEAQTSMTNHSFRIIGDDGHNSWLDICICGWKRSSEKAIKKEDGSDISLIKWSTPSSEECGANKICNQPRIHNTELTCTMKKPYKIKIYRGW